MIKYLRKSTKEGNIYFSSVSELSVHSYLALLLLGSCIVKQNFIAGSMSCNKMVHLIVERRQRVTEQARNKIYSPKACA